MKIKSSDIKEGMRFSAPVFFDDGKNMFLAEGKSAKPYHLNALKRWSIPFLLTYGHELTNNVVQGTDDDDDSLEPLDSLDAADEVSTVNASTDEDVSSLFLDSNSAAEIKKTHIA